MAKMANAWPKGPTEWIDNRVLYISIPFTWNLAAVKTGLYQLNLLWDRVVVGGPAVLLSPGYFSDIDYVQEMETYDGVLQKVNPRATKTTVGCSRRCRFCAVPKVEGGLRELEDWPNLPIICDNNLLAASKKHIERVMERLARIGEADFNQGLDARLLTADHARMISEIKHPVVRLALDSPKHKEVWASAYELLRGAKIAKSKIKTYCLVAYNSGPSEAWERCQWIEKHGVDAYPMWFHTLDAEKVNVVTAKQRKSGWNDRERRKIMQWFYQHKKAK